MNHVLHDPGNSYWFVPLPRILPSFHLVNMDLSSCSRNTFHPRWATQSQFMSFVDQLMPIIFRVSPLLLAYVVNYMVTFPCSVQKRLFLGNFTSSTKSGVLLFVLITHPVSFSAVVITRSLCNSLLEVCFSP